MATTVSRHVTLARATIALHTRPQPVIAVRCCCGPRRRHLSHSSLTQAKLVDPHVSIIPGQVNSLPPTAPLPQPLSSSSSPSSSSNRAQTQSRSTSKHARVAHKRDLGSIVAFDLFLLRLVHQLGNKLGKAQPPPPPLPTLFHQSTARAGKQLDHVLKYESTPSQDRRVRTTAPNDAARAVSPGDIHDGIVVVAHVIGGDDPLVSVCSGFAVGSADDQGPVQILTCHHTLDQMRNHWNKVAKRADILSRPAPPPSATIVLSTSGLVWTAASVATSLPSSDLLILELSSTPIRDNRFEREEAQSSSASAAAPRLQSLPVNPYPSPVGTPVSTLAFRNPVAWTDQSSSPHDWTPGTVVEYRDAMGQEARTGTYDDLAIMRLSAVPRDGSSGGPIVDAAGSVVGIIRGSTQQYGDPVERGFATPAERVFELFQLPGFKSNSLQTAKDDRQSHAAVRSSPKEPGEDGSS